MYPINLSNNSSNEELKFDNTPMGILMFFNSFVSSKIFHDKFMSKVQPRDQQIEQVQDCIWKHSYENKSY